MKTLFENGRLTVYFEGRIDTNNAPAVDKDLKDAVSASGAEDIVIDADKLEYISSAGLRVLMKLRKGLSKPIPVINVSNDVYDIFETTGFTELLEITKKLREISVEGCEIVGQGGNGTVYRLDEDKIVKLYNSGGRALVDQEQRFARTAFVSGIPTVIPYDVVRCGERYGVVFELLRSDTLGHAISREPARMPELVDQYVALAKELHSTSVEKGALPDVRVLMRERVSRLDRWCSAEEIAELMSIVDAIPECDTVIHGDLHPGNIMIQDGELLLIDLAEVTVGPRAFDLASIFRDMIAGARTDEKMTEMTIGMPVAMVEQTAQLFFMKYTGITDPAGLKAYFDKLGLIYAFNVVLLCGSGIGAAEAHAPRIMKNLLHPVVLANKDAIPYIISTL